MRTATAQRPPIHRFMLAAFAPLLGFGIWICWAGFSLELEAAPPPVADAAAPSPWLQSGQALQARLSESTAAAASVKDDIAGYLASYRESSRIAGELALTAKVQASRPLVIYDRRITAKLGKPIWHTSSANIDLKLFLLQEQNYQAYALKAQLKTDQAMRLVLGQDELGKAETTLEAVQRTGGIAGVNAGGFADDPKSGKRYPLSNTMLGGSFVYGFQPTFKDLFFVGLNDRRELVGGKFTKQEELEELNPVFGASFVPVLLKDGKAQAIPDKWLTQPHRAARTVVANYKNDHLLFLVVEGRDESGRSGASLPELQSLLKRLGAVDAYNLDGGGSTTLVVNGKLKNNPSDGTMRKLPTNFVFYE